MTDIPSLPNLNEYPSPLDTYQVNDLLRRILSVIDSNSNIHRNDAAECMLESIFARGHRPGETFDPELADRAANWIVAEWPVADTSFAHTSISLLANLPRAITETTLVRLLALESRIEFREDLVSLLSKVEDIG